MKQRSQPPDPKQVVHGKVVDTMGKPVREALISQQGVLFEQGRRFGDIDWIDLVAVSNREGEFEIAYSKPVTGMILEVTPRGMAPVLTTLTTGAERHTVVVTEGATIRGCLVSNGKPVANAEMILNTHSRYSGTIFKDVRIGTNEDGEFAITNVPAGRIWDLAARMESLAPRGLATPNIYVETKDDGEEVNAGEIEARPGVVLRGRIVLSDGAPIPADMRVSIGSDRGVDRQVLVLPPDGAFEFKGLDKGVYALQPSVKGYRVRNSEFGVELLMQANRDNLVVTLDPVKPQAK
ncbi:MAG: carboxypeptidase regulatory-like domain-containing protein [Acidobacteria bacterium]|nr:carboxypeptidase regulatory-like domain-containing protein [Acidobacteriota bacterium]